MNLHFVTAFLDRADSSPGRPVTIAAARADETGAFVFPDVPPGAYRIRADTSASSGGYAASDALSANLPITVDRDIKDLSVPLMPGNEVSGSVRFEGNMPAPPGFASVAMSFSPANGRSPGINRASGTVATHFWTRGLAPDKYFLRVALPPPGGWRLKDAMLDGRDVTEVPFDTSAGRVYDLIVTFTDRQTRIGGLVRDASGREAPEATVVLFSTNPDAWTNTSFRRVKVVEATQHGRFSVANLPPGEYFAVAVPSTEDLRPDLSVSVAWLQRVAASASRVQLRDDEPLNLDLVLGERYFGFLGR